MRRDSLSKRYASSGERKVTFRNCVAIPVYGEAAAASLDALFTTTLGLQQWALGS